MQPSAVLAESERLAVVLGALMVLLLAALDQTIVSPALPTIGANLGDVDWLAWVVSAYFLTATAVTPLYGKLADLRGRRPTLYGAVAIFTLGSMICATAPNMTIMILGRAVQGLGGGGLVSLVQTIIGDVVPPQERAKYMVYISTVWAVASIGGPLAGGVFAEHLHWSMIFWINLPLSAIAFAMIHHSLRRIPDVTRPARLDLVGAGLIVVATVAFMLALTWGGNRFAWGSATILGLFAVSIVFALWFARHIAHTEEALIPLDILRNPVIAVVVSALFFSMGAYVGLSVYMPLWFELVTGAQPASAGFGLLALTLGTVGGATLGGRAMAHIVHYRRAVLAGSALAIVSTTLLAAFATEVGFWGVEAILAFVGLGTGSIFPIGTVAVQNSVERRDLGVAMGTLAFMRSLGSVVAVTVLGAVLAAAGVAGVGEGMLHPGHVDPTAGAAFRGLFAVVVIGQVVGFVLLCFLEERPLRGHAPPAAPE